MSESAATKRRANAITASAAAALTELLEPIIARAVAAAAEEDPLVEITREQWPLRPILEAVRRGELKDVSRVGRRYYAPRSVLKAFIAAHKIKPPKPADEAPPAAPEQDDVRRMMAELVGRGRRR